MQLVIGDNPGDLVVGYLLGQGISTALRLQVDGVDQAWPAAPVLEFQTFSLVAVLTSGNALATWTSTPEQVAALHNAASKAVRLTVQGRAWWAGRAQNRA